MSTHWHLVWVQRSAMVKKMGFSMARTPETVKAQWGGHGLVAMGDCEECRRVYCERSAADLTVSAL
jgi:hypothetical protein